MRVTITDLVGGAGAVTVEKFDIAETIRPWFPDAPPDVVSAIADLETSVMADDWVWVAGLAEFLGLDVEFTGR